MTTGSSSHTGPAHKLVEAGVTLLIALFGVIVIVGSVKAGINWGAEGPRAGFFPGSTIGNFEPHQACSFLRHAGRMLGRGATLIIGVDLVKDASILNAAYDDAAGVTAKFNLNLLTRINRELDGHFDLDSFSHHAFYNSERHRIEMHLASKKRQKVRVAGRQIEFRAGETIHTENSYKYSAEGFGALAAGAGFRSAQRWTDRQGLFALFGLN